LQENHSAINNIKHTFCQEPPANAEKKLFFLASAPIPKWTSSIASLSENVAWFTRWRHYIAAQAAYGRDFLADRTDTQYNLMLDHPVVHLSVCLSATLNESKKTRTCVFLRYRKPRVRWFIARYLLLRTWEDRHRELWS